MADQITPAQALQEMQIQLVPNTNVPRVAVTANAAQYALARAAVLAVPNLPPPNLTRHTIQEAVDNRQPFEQNFEGLGIILTLGFGEAWTGPE